MAEDIERRPAEASDKGDGKEVEDNPQEVSPFDMKPIDAVGQGHLAVSFLLGAVPPPSELDAMHASLSPDIQDAYALREFLASKELEAEPHAGGQTEHEQHRKALDTQNKRDNAARAR